MTRVLNGVGDLRHRGRRKIGRSELQIDVLPTRLPGPRHDNLSPEQRRAVDTPSLRSKSRVELFRCPHGSKDAYGATRDFSYVDPRPGLLGHTRFLVDISSLEFNGRMVPQHEEVVEPERTLVRWPNKPRELVPLDRSAIGQLNRWRDFDLAARLRIRHRRRQTHERRRREPRAY